MNKLAVIAHNINNSVVEQRRLDGYINATALASAYKLATGKRRDVGHWLELERTIIYVRAFEFNHRDSGN
jgi:hypothetical protein